jgi:pyruvate formate lyase activating enzyme
MTTAVITNIQGYSIHDGPGIRTVVFFKGCPLSCQWCANPECLSKKPQIGFIKSLCQQCGKCLDVCPNNAIRAGEDVYRIDHSRCESCGKCSDHCSYGALVRYGNPMTVEETWDAVKRDKMFYETSGGGVTVSGGEPLLNSGFVRELFELCREEQIGTCIETCGFVESEVLLEVFPVTDLFLFDLKHMDSDIHRKYTGHSNKRILKNAASLIDRAADVIFRQPLIPGFNDSLTNIEVTAKFLTSLGENAVRLQLMPYHRMGRDKYTALNKEYYMNELGIMENDELEAVKNAYIDCGIDCSISR